MVLLGFIAGIILCWLVGILALKRGWSKGWAWFWGIASLFVTPILPALLIYAMPNKVARCPDCAEPINKDAKKCKHCGAMLVQVKDETKKEKPVVLDGLSPNYRPEKKDDLAPMAAVAAMAAMSIDDTPTRSESGSSSSSSLDSSDSSSTSGD